MGVVGPLADVPTYSEHVAAKVLRILVLAALAAAGVWWGRLIAHSKDPAPEGHWREIPGDAFE
jgi:hypothetical protein